MEDTSDLLTNENPIDSISRGRKDGMPKSIRMYLATVNMRPVGMLLRITTPLHPWPWNNLNDKQWKAEMLFNNGNFIEILLRLPGLSGFNKLFDELEVEYSAMLKKTSWVPKIFQNSEKAIPKILGKLEPLLLVLESKFVEWAVANRKMVQSAFERVYNSEELGSGNALKDLEKLAPEWLESL